MQQLQTTIAQQKKDQQEREKRAEQNWLEIQSKEAESRRAHELQLEGIRNERERTIQENAKAQLAAEREHSKAMLELAAKKDKETREALERKNAEERQL